MKHEMKLQNNPFIKIKTGQKIYELRLNDEKRQKLKIGDFIEFLNIDTNEKILTKIQDIKHFENFEQLYKSIDKLKLGYQKNDIASSHDMEQYYSKSEQEKYKVLAIEIKLIEK